MHIVEWAAIPSKLRLDGVMAMGAKFSKTLHLHSSFVALGVSCSPAPIS